MFSVLFLVLKHGFQSNNFNSQSVCALLRGIYTGFADSACCTFLFWGVLVVVKGTECVRNGIEVVCRLRKK